MSACRARVHSFGTLLDPSFTFSEVVVAVALRPAITATDERLPALQSRETTDPRFPKTSFKRSRVRAGNVGGDGR